LAVCDRGDEKQKKEQRDIFHGLLFRGMTIARILGTLGCTVVWSSTRKLFFADFPW
jgi:hypothetical protein